MHKYLWLASSMILFTLLAARGSADDKPSTTVADADLAAWVDKRVNDWQPTAEEKRFDEIGWLHNVLDAEKLAAEHKRPIFLFTHDGKMNVGRC